MRPRLYRHEKGKNKQGRPARGGEERAIAGAVRGLKSLPAQPLTGAETGLKSPLFSRAFLILIHWQQQENKTSTLGESYRQEIQTTTRNH